MPRLPEVTRPDKDNEQAYEYLQKTRGAVRGGFAVMLASPDVTQRIAHVGTYVRFETPLPADMRELAALTVSAELENPTEYVIHARTCREVGVAESVVTAVLERAPVAGASADQMLAIDMARELTRHHRLSAATFEAARKRLGEKGVVDLIATAGYYAMLAVCHVALDVTPRPS
jgi:4-carboxymuconolactone decarboxylase